VLVKDNGRRVAPDVVELAHVVAPQLLALEVIAVDAGRSVAGDDSFAVGRGSASAERVGGMGRLVGLVVDPALPQLVAVLAVEAEHAALVPLLVERLRDEDAVFPDDRAGVAGPWQGDLPAHVFLLVPLERHSAGARMIVAVRPAPHRPVLSVDGSGENE